MVAAILWNCERHRWLMDKVNIPLRQNMYSVASVYKPSSIDIILAISVSFKQIEITGTDKKKGLLGIGYLFEFVIFIIFEKKTFY